jgi:hypothetical protein
MDGSGASGRSRWRSPHEQTTIDSEILMPPTKTPPEPGSPAQGEPDPLQEVLKTLVALQESAQASRRDVLDSSGALMEANRANLEQLAERLIEATQRTAHELSEAIREGRPDRIVIEQAPPVEDAVTREQRLRQRELVLTYDAWRTMLGRAPTSGAPGAAAVFTAIRVDDKNQPDEDGDSIRILAPAPFAVAQHGWSLTAITSTNHSLRAELEPHAPPFRVQVPHLAADVDIRRLEIRDANDNPIYLGVGPATQTHNAARYRHKRHVAPEGGEHGEEGRPEDTQELYNRIPVDQGTR